MTQQYIKPSAAATYAGVSVPTIRDWMANGLPHYILGPRTTLLKVADIDDYVERFRVTADYDEFEKMFASAGKNE